MEKVGPDSYFIKHHLKRDEATNIYNSLMNEPNLFVPRDTRAMKYRGNNLNRSKFFLVDIHKKKGYPKYYYTGFQYASMLYYSDLKKHELLYNMAHSVSNLEIGGINSNINHIIGTLYIDGNDNIGWHNDKMKSIRPNSNIYILSFGGTREFAIRKNDSKDTVWSKKLRRGDLFVLGPKTNSMYQHTILKTNNKVNPRLSLVLRDITEYVKLEAIKRKATTTELENKLSGNEIINEFNE